MAVIHFGSWSPVTALSVASVVLASCSGTVSGDVGFTPLDASTPPAPTYETDITSEESAARPEQTTSPVDSLAPAPTSGPSATSPTTSATAESSNSETPTTSCAEQVIDPGPAPALRLTRRQYLNTVRDLFGEVPDLASVFTQPSSASGIGAGQGDIGLLEIEEFQRAAELIAKSVATPNNISKLAPCDDTQEVRTCVSTFVTTFGTRLYRSAVTAEEDLERHWALFEVGAETDYRTGIELLLRGMLQSARFIYRLEVGNEVQADATRVQLTDYEVATRLAYTLLDTTPNDALLEAAALHRLSSPEDIKQVVGSVFESSASASPMQRFLEELVHLQGLETLDKDPTLYPEWSPELKRELTLQAQRFFDYVLRERAGSLAELFTSDTVSVNSTLAFYYYDVDASDFGTFSLPEAAGLLTLPAFLSLNAKPDESSPVYRGKFVRELLLCQPPPPPPPDIPKAPKVDSTASTRERLAQHEVDPDCSGCHQLLDPIGFAFEHYDAIGRYRETDGDQPVDARGELIAAGDITGPVDGVNELAALLAKSQRVDECIARQWFRYVFSRLETKADACSVEQLVAEFRDSSNNLNSLPQAIVLTDAFRYRRTPEPSATEEVKP